jgi:hypothetical protein
MLQNRGEHGIQQTHTRVLTQVIKRKAGTVLSVGTSDHEILDQQGEPVAIGGGDLSAPTDELAMVTGNEIGPAGSRSEC